MAEAQTAIVASFAAASTAIRTLDIVVPNTVEEDAVVFAGWKRSREVVGARRRRKAKSDNKPARGR